MGTISLLGVRTISQTVNINTWYNLSDFFQFYPTTTTQISNSDGSIYAVSMTFLDPSASLPNNGFRQTGFNLQESNYQDTVTGNGTHDYGVFATLDGYQSAGNYAQYAVNFSSIKIEFTTAGQITLSASRFPGFAIYENAQTPDGRYSVSSVVPEDFSGVVTVLAASAYSIQPLDANKALTTPQGAAFHQTIAQTNFTFTVTRSGDLSTSENVTYSVAGSGTTPASADDFQLTLPHGTLTFAAGESSKVVTLILSDYLAEIAQSAGFTIALTDSHGGTSSAVGTIETPSAPGEGILADLADAVYTPSINNADGYLLLDHLALTDAGGGFNIETFQDGNQLVVAFKGTDSLDDFVADASWATAAPNSFLQFFYNSAIAYVRSTVASHAGAAITLTGHSLGGAIAELVSAATSYSATVFNAPGARQYEPALGIPAQRESLSNVTNYRAAGDQVSLAGTQIGNLNTLPSPYPDTWVDALSNHRLTTVIGSLASTPITQEAALTTATLLLGDGSSISDGGIFSKTLNSFSVSDLIQYAVDPSGSSTFDFREDQNSPFIATVEMPPSDGVGSYAVTFITGSGPTQQSLAPDQIANAPAGTTEVRFTALDASGNPIILPTNTIFGISFASAGTLNASITADTVTANPVYRFFDTTFGTHLFTQSLTEAQTILTTRPDLTQETNGFGAVSAANPSAEPVYRFFETSNGTHFFTASAAEYQGLTTPSSTTYRPDFTYEVSSTFYEDANQQAGDVPVYRLFDSAHGTQFLTGDQTEYAGLTTAGASTYRSDLQSEGIAFYAPAGSFHT